MKNTTKKNQRINTEDYEFRPINRTFSYLFEFGKENARVTYIENSSDRKYCGVVYEKTEKISELEGPTREDQKYRLLVHLGMIIGKDHLLGKIKRAYTGFCPGIDKIINQCETQKS